MPTWFFALVVTTAQATTLPDGQTGAPHDAARPATPVSFNESIRPIFAKHCVACHGGVKQASGLSLIYRDQATSETESGAIAIVPGDADASALVERVSDEDPDYRMPPGDHGPPLSKSEVAALRRWIDEGARWERHWAFAPPGPFAPPSVRDGDWPRQPLDRFVLAKLESSGLTPNAEADRATWLRRVSFDLTGLPPSPDEYDAFLADTDAGAYERVADRLLASPHFGERWTAMWLDLARYADTQGYEKDPHRDIWPYRDWLIRSFNQDMPYDEFTIQQLAGDLLPEAGIDERLATAMHRNTQTNTEGGTDDEEFRIAAVLDRVSTTWQVWQATTFRCAQCHSHPYDPIRHEEFYKFFAVFNTSRDVDVSEDLPLLAVPNDVEQWPRANEIDRRLADLRREIFRQSSEIAEEASVWSGLRPRSAVATGQTQLAIRDPDEAGVAEIVAHGTISARSSYALEFDLGEFPRPLTALRIDALPKDLAKARKTPEMGFVLTKLEAQLISNDGAHVAPVEFALVFCDESSPILDPQESLAANNKGWASYPRISQSRYAVFAPAEPIEPPPGSRLRLTLQFGRTAVGDIALCILRGRFQASADPRWTALIASGRLQDRREEIAALAAERNAMPSTLVPVMSELADRFRRETFVFQRGNWLDKGEQVEPGVPQLFPPPADQTQVDRLATARWLVSGENPLTARVMVNRLWQELFGVGIVETADDFGTSGALPSHPRLLDHLALRFQDEHAWSVKQLLREIVLSATYRQHGGSTPEKQARDPRNRLLARGPRTRLAAEMIRDQALALSGKLNAQQFGPPAMPPQPEGVWRSVYSGAQWKTAEGPDRFRRAVYTYWKRTSGYPTFLAFDMPSRDVCVARRHVTNTPLQALATLNDEALVELAVALAKRMQADGGAAAPQRIAAAYRWALGKEIDAARLARLEQLHQEALEAFRRNPDQARQLADTDDLFALAAVANALLNLDEVLTK